MKVSGHRMCGTQEKLLVVLEELEEEGDINKLTNSIVNIVNNKMQTKTMNSDQVVEQEESHCDDEESLFQDIDTLQNYGINVADIKKLKGAGICTVKGILMTTKKRMAAVKGISEAKIEKIKEIAGKIAHEGKLGQGKLGKGKLRPRQIKIKDPGFMTALEVSDKRKQVFRISTGSSELDKLLGGGIESMSITEAFGEFRTGKTQISHTICVSCQMPGENGFTGGKAIFIDTENTLYPLKIEDNF
ncbi:Meiotic recombination protein DMC1/LIM15 [Nymphon striatum]|nr:Meiotic recombination protein DMC1/LIM15 [Nymphon striatum]